MHVGGVILSETHNSSQTYNPTCMQEGEMQRRPFEELVNLDITYMYMHASLSLVKDKHSILIPISSSYRS